LITFSVAAVVKVDFSVRYGKYKSGSEVSPAAAAYPFGFSAVVKKQ
jgi:hypothetical protein